MRNLLLKATLGSLLFFVIVPFTAGGHCDTMHGAAVKAASDMG